MVNVCILMISVRLDMRVTFVLFFKQKTAYELRIRDWSSDVCSSDLLKLPTGICSRIFGEGANIGLATSQPLYRLHEAGCIKTETLIQAPSPWAFGGWDLRLPLRGTVALLAALPKPASGLGPR